jgi:putative acyl-CoA dehydrogenase
MTGTHEVFNQVPPLEGYDVFRADSVLSEAVERFGAAWAVEELTALGQQAGGAEAIAWGQEANRYEPVLHTHDRYGNRCDEVTYHPSYHRLMATAVQAGLHAAPWALDRTGAHVARAAGFMVWSQVEGGHLCPISMTYAAVPALQKDQDLAAQWVPGLAAHAYDPTLRSPSEKPGLIAGMAMTEKQGGSDVRANTTRAVPAPDGTYRLSGHKWFCSAPMSDLFLVLAQAPGGLSCFVVPRILPDGSKNALHFQRLKDKLGNRSNASSEVEYLAAHGWLLGPEGRGVATIVEMVNATRLDCVLGSAAGMRQAVAQATHHAAHRKAFGAELIDQPLMRNVLADLAIESEAATLLGLRLAYAVEAGDDPQQRAFRRIATAVGKYYVCKRGPVHAGEALECLGGNGYVEESGMPRLYRDAPLNSVWEGSGNVNALDVLRAMKRTPDVVDAYFAEVSASAGADARLDGAIQRLQGLLDSDIPEGSARRLVEQLALVLQGSLLVRWSPPAVADAFCASRLGGDWGVGFGTLPTGLDLGAILERARPKLG